MVSPTIALLGILADCIANMYHPARHNFCSKATLSNEELQDRAMGPACEKITRLTKRQTFKSCTADSKAFATEFV
jgi:hypothetical protein